MDIMMLRIGVSLILLVSVLFMPLWVSLLLALVGMVFFSYFFEAVALLLLSDLLFGVKEARFFNIFFVSMLLSLALLIVMEIFKTKSAFYTSSRINK